MSRCEPSESSALRVLGVRRCAAPRRVGVTESDEWMSPRRFLTGDAGAGELVRRSELRMIEWKRRRTRESLGVPSPEQIDDHRSRRACDVPSVLPLRVKNWGMPSETSCPLRKRVRRIVCFRQTVTHGQTAVCAADAVCSFQAHDAQRRCSLESGVHAGERASPKWKVCRGGRATARAARLTWIARHRFLRLLPFQCRPCRTLESRSAAAKTWSVVKTRSRPGADETRVTCVFKSASGLAGAHPRSL
jgi:hypothetical protein